MTGGSSIPSVSRFKFGKLRDRSPMEWGERTRLKRGCWPHHVWDMEEGSSEIYINIPSNEISGIKIWFWKCWKRFHGRTLPSASPPWQLENQWLLGFSETDPRAEQLRKHIADHMFQSLIFCVSYSLNPGPFVALSVCKNWEHSQGKHHKRLS